MRFAALRRALIMAGSALRAIEATLRGVSLMEPWPSKRFVRLLSAESPRVRTDERIFPVERSISGETPWLRFSSFRKNASRSFFVFMVLMKIFYPRIFKTVNA